MSRLRKASSEVSVLFFHHNTGGEGGDWVWSPVRIRKADTVELHMCTDYWFPLQMGSVQGSSVHSSTQSSLSAERKMLPTTMHEVFTLWAPRSSALCGRRSESWQVTPLSSDQAVPGPWWSAVGCTNIIYRHHQATRSFRLGVFVGVQSWDRGPVLALIIPCYIRRVTEGFYWPGGPIYPCFCWCRVYLAIGDFGSTLKHQVTAACEVYRTHILPGD